jgi:D-alanyl-D-alanine-carboxypeptidase/D-alanyl-D-alanine-endopeptidase
MDLTKIKGFLVQHCSSSRAIVRCCALLMSLATIAGSFQLGWAQERPNVAGDYVGTLGPLHLKLHLKVDAAGATTGTLDSVDQGALGIPCADFRLDGRAFSFTVPAVHGKWSGTVTADGFTGTWDQGNPQPLNFSRDTFVPAAKPSAVDGIWLGTLNGSLRVQLIVKSDASGKEYCALDSLDQRAMGLECDKVIFAVPNFSFGVPGVNGHWEGKLSANGQTLAGTWNQGTPRALNLTRQSTALAPPAIPAPSYDPAIPPVSAADLRSVLDKDLAEAIQSGHLSAATGGGVSIGVVEHGVHRVFSYGTARPDSIFEIGSITKTFTALILSQMVEQGKVHLDDPVRELLPAGTVEKPAGAEITLGDLATQHSGLPRMPNNFHPADNANPYADYLPDNLYAFMREHGVVKPADAGFLYSNLGFGLLGQALAVHARMPYPALLQQEVTDPLGLHDTVISLNAEQRARFIVGHDAEHRAAHAWDLVALAGAGAIRSTASDMLTYLEAQLHPESMKPGAAGTPAGTLPAAITFQHELRSDAGPSMKIALAWLWEPGSGNYWHNGGTGGYTSYAFFNPKGDYAAVVLFNTTLDPEGSFADRLGEHISERMAGKPAISLAK